MKVRTVALAMAFGLVVGIILFAQIHHDDRRGVGVGLMRAEAVCTDEAPRCLPKIDMVDTSGRTWSPADLDEKVVVVNVWATWCRPCALEIPDLAATYADYRDRGVVMIGLLADGVDDARLATFAAQVGVNYPIVRMDDALARGFDNPTALPTTFVYDRRGHMRYGRPGIVTREDLSSILDQLVADEEAVVDDQGSR